MSKSLKSNIFYNVINAAVSFLLPIITLPYATRVLQADGIGQVDFFNSIINYIILATSLGIPLYAVREVARCRDNKVLFNKTVSEIYILQNILALLGYVVVLVLIGFYAKVHDNIILFAILSLTIFFNAVGAQWFFQAIEDFKYIAIRALWVKLSCLILIFVFVKDHDDLLIYAVITVFINIGNALFNVRKLFKCLDISFLKTTKLQIFRHVKPASKVYALNLSTSLYNYLNVFLLGILTSSTIVAYFSVPLKLTALFLGITSIISTVLIPRFSNIASNGTEQEFRRLGQTIFCLINLIVIPLSIFIIIQARSIILLICGDEFRESINVLRIIALIIILIGNSGMIGLQFLYPKGKENIVIISTCVGAISNLILNILLIPYFYEIGAAIATVGAESLVLITICTVGKKYLPIRFYDKNILQILLASSVMACILLFIERFQISPVFSLIVGSLVALLSYILVLSLARNKYLLYLFFLTSQTIKKVI